MHRCAKLSDSAETETKPSTPAVSAAARPVVKPAPAAPARTREEEKRARALKRQAERRVSEYEARIAEIEAAQTERSSQLSKPETYADATLYARLLDEYRRDAGKLEELLGRWEAAQSDLGGLDETAE
jgi:ATP-binding cassette subfamily F protein 3